MQVRALPLFAPSSRSTAVKQFLLTAKSAKFFAKNAKKFMLSQLSIRIKKKKIILRLLTSGGFRAL